ncbi:MAG: hypothetical protein ACK56I_23350, partial [bacterium]
VGQVSLTLCLTNQIEEILAWCFDVEQVRSKETDKMRVNNQEQSSSVPSVEACTPLRLFPTGDLKTIRRHRQNLGHTRASNKYKLCPTKIGFPCLPSSCLLLKVLSHVYGPQTSMKSWSLFWLFLCVRPRH